MTPLFFSLIKWTAILTFPGAIPVGLVWLSVRKQRRIAASKRLRLLSRNLDFDFRGGDDAQPSKFR